MIYKSRLYRVGVTLLLVFFPFSLGIESFGQQNSSSDSPSQSDPRLNTLKDQIQQVKKRLSGIGPKHPSWNAMSKRLSDLETQLEKIRLADSTKPPEKKPPEKKPPEKDPRSKLDPGLLGKTEPSAKKELGLAPKPVLPLSKNSVRDSTPILRDPSDKWIQETISRWKGAPYVGYSKPLSLIGLANRRSPNADPNSKGLLQLGLNDYWQEKGTSRCWGLELDSYWGCSCLWVWDGQSTDKKKTQVWETPGAILDILVETTARVDGIWYVLRKSATENGTVELVELQSSFVGQLPGTVEREKLLARLVLERNPATKDSVQMRFGADSLGNRLVISENSFVSQALTDTYRTESMDPTTLVFWGESDPPDLISVRRNWLKMSKEIMYAQRAIIEIAGDSELSQAYHQAVVDRNNHRNSILAFIDPESNNFEPDTGDFDGGISLGDTGMFLSIVEMQPRDFFFEYEVSSTDRYHGFKSRFWIALPRGEQITQSRPLNWEFPVGTIILQVDPQDLLLESRSIDGQDIVRVFLKSTERWISYVFTGQSATGDLALLQSGEESLGSRSPGIKESKGVFETENCRSCHLNSINDGILGFHPMHLSDRNSEGLLQRRYLELSGVFSNSSLASVPVDREKASLDLAQKASASVKRISNATVTWTRAITGDSKGATLDFRMGILLMTDRMVDPSELDKSEESLGKLTSAIEQLLESRNSSFYEENGHQSNSFLQGLVDLFSEALFIVNLDRSDIPRFKLGELSIKLRKADIFSTISQSLDLQASVWYSLASSFMELSAFSGGQWALEDGLQYLGLLERLVKDPKTPSDLKALSFRRLALLHLRAYELTGSIKHRQAAETLWLERQTMYDDKSIESIEDIAMTAQRALRVLRSEAFVDSNLAEVIEDLNRFESAMGKWVEDPSRSPLDLHQQRAVLDALYDANTLIPETLFLRYR